MGAGLGKRGPGRIEPSRQEGETLPRLIGLEATPGALSPEPLGHRLELPPEEGSPYSPEFSSGWEPPATDPQGRAWGDPVEKQQQHERRRRQVSTGHPRPPPLPR